MSFFDPPGGDRPPINSKSLKGKTAAELFPPDGKGISPYHPQQLLDIFVAPRDFFIAGATLGKSLNCTLAAWLMGFVALFYVVLGDTFLTMEGEASQLPPELLQSWAQLWTTLLVGGAIVGVFVWVVGGWWFQMRVLLSGAPKPDLRLSRLVFVYAGLARSLPPLIMLVLWTLRYPNYAAVPTREVFIGATLCLVFAFGELTSAYVGVNTLFRVDGVRSLIWFIVGPAAWYVISLGL